MKQTSTLKLWEDLLQENDSSFGSSIQNILSKYQHSPKKETIDIILAYAASAQAIQTKLNEKILISLN
mgnify:CR=1 FL=1